VPVLVCHDEVVVECPAEQAADAKAWLEQATIEGMDTVVNGTSEGHVPVEVEARIAEVGETEVSLMFRHGVLSNRDEAVRFQPFFRGVSPWDRSPTTTVSPHTDLARPAAIVVAMACPVRLSRRLTA
jgi:hypothetical protein